jgi:hypothetical protein
MKNILMNMKNIEEYMKNMKILEKFSDYFFFEISKNI